VVDIPANINHFGSHACFGYRALESSFGSLADFFLSVKELCGTSELPCPTSSPPSSPETIDAQLPLALPKSKAHSFFTAGDFVADDEDLEAVLARLQRAETGNLPQDAPAVRSNQLTSAPALQKSSTRPRPTKRARDVSQDLVGIPFYLPGCELAYPDVVVRGSAYLNRSEGCKENKKIKKGDPETMPSQLSER
jgi:hypothetical protein